MPAEHAVVFAVSVCPPEHCRPLATHPAARRRLATHLSSCPSTPKLSSSLSGRTWPQRSLPSAQKAPARGPATRSSAAPMSRSQRLATHANTQKTQGNRAYRLDECAAPRRARAGESATRAHILALHDQLPLVRVVGGWSLFRHDCNGEGSGIAATGQLEDWEGGGRRACKLVMSWPLDCGFEAFARWGLMMQLQKSQAFHSPQVDFRSPALRLGGRCAVVDCRWGISGPHMRTLVAGAAESGSQHPGSIELPPLHQLNPLLSLHTPPSSPTHHTPNPPFFEKSCRAPWVFLRELRPTQLLADRAGLSSDGVK